MMRQLFTTRVPGIVTDPQVQFQPPDQDWRKEVINLNDLALNVYLIEMKENRRLRTNERVRDVQAGVATDQPAPRRVDCHYLITAWSPVTPSLMVEPTVDEHKLLYAATNALMDNDPLEPRKVYFPAPLPLGFPASIADAQLPVVVLPQEGFPKYAEFWGTMQGAANHPWKPAVYLIVTLPVQLEKQVAGPLVTTRITEYLQSGTAQTVEVWVEIGGTVLDAKVPPEFPVPGAWVSLEEVAGTRLATTITDELGRFVFNKIRPGNYLLRWRAGARPEPLPRAIAVPSPTGEYDLRFT
jgi:hypothetical protein